MTYRTATILTASLTASLGTAALAAPASDTFDTSPTIGATQAPDTWYTDRYAPAAFESAFFDGDNRLLHSIDDADGANSRPSGFSSSFYNTQGRKYDLGDVDQISIDLYVDSSWETTNRRMAGLWGTGEDINGDISFYAILEFASDGTSGGFQVWDGVSGFQSIGLPTGFAYDNWYTLDVTLDTVNDQFIFSVGDASTTFAANGTVDFREVILQGHNTTEGVSYDIYWDNFEAVPEPGSLALIGLGGLALLRRRRH